MPDNKTPEWIQQASAQAATNLINRVPDVHAIYLDAIVHQVRLAIAAHAPQAAVSAAEVRAKFADDPYFTEVDDNGCSHCSAGRTWCVVGPDGDRGSTSYEDEDAAIDLADKLNDAFALGRSSRDNATLLSALQIADTALCSALEGLLNGEAHVLPHCNPDGASLERSEIIRDRIRKSKADVRAALSAIHAVLPSEHAATQNGER